MDIEWVTTYTDSLGIASAAFRHNPGIPLRTLDSFHPLFCAFAGNTIDAFGKGDSTCFRRTDGTSRQEARAADPMGGISAPPSRVENGKRGFFA
jgi:hypothetical protein